MKTSNKILLGLFLLPFITATIIITTLYAKHKSGNYITEAQHKNENSTTAIISSFENIELFQYKGDVSIVKSDSFAVSVDNWAKDKIKYVVNGNTLQVNTIDGDYAHMTILCPSFSKLSADSSTVNINRMHLNNALINAKSQSNITFSSAADSLTLNIEKGAGINFNDQSSINLLNLSLANGAALNVTNGSIKNIGQVALEDSASLSVDGKTMRMILERKNNTPQQ